MDKSFEILIHENRQMMLTYARALLGSEFQQAEDVVQETCLVAYQKLDQFDPQQSFPKWLRGIIRNKVRENKRALQRYPWITDPVVIEGMEDIYQSFDRVKTNEEWLHRIAIMKKCIEKLNTRMRKTIELIYQSGLSLKEVALEMSTNVMAAGQRASRARKLIRTCVQRQLKLEEI